MGTDQGTGAPPTGGAGTGMAGLQFDKVDAPPNATRTCAACQRGIENEYFELGGRVVCATCAASLKGKGGARPFVRALLFGGAAALLSTIVWYLIIKLFNMELGLIAIGVGLFVGMAVRRGALARGGWKYQALAMALTYGAVTFSKAPLLVQAIAETQAKKKAGGDAAGSSGDDKQAKPTAVDGAPTGDGKAPAPAKKQPVHLGEVLIAFLFIGGLALASPFLAGTENIMGLIIIGIALYEAWKINRRVPLEGPFRLAPSGTALAPPPVMPPPAGP